jgi:hypothetical protein
VVAGVAVVETTPHDEPFIAPRFQYKLNHYPLRRTLMNRTAIMLTIALGTTACGPSGNNFNTKYAKTACSAMEECEGASFSDYYSSRDDCISELEGYYDEDEYYEGCDFDRGVAKEILKEVKDYGKSCNYSDLDSYVSDAWDCSGGGGGSFDTAW